MKITMIIGSPRTGKSTSLSLAEQLVELLGKQHEYCFIHCNKTVPSDIELQSIASSEAIIFSFPLYVDAIPSHFLNVLKYLENYFQTIQNATLPKVYGIINCGFFEADQNRYALEILENWCRRSGLSWGMGIGIGAGPMISQVRVPLGKGIKKQIGAVYSALAAAILDQQTAESQFASPDFPKRLYIAIAHFGWWAEAKRNHIKTRDLYRRAIKQEPW